MTKHEYFLVHYQLAINVQPLQDDESIPEQGQFEAEIPAPFRMASDLSELDSTALHRLKLNNETTQTLWQFLDTQNQKINILLTYILSQQDESQYRFKTDAFSAGCCLFDCSGKNFYLSQLVRLKIFLPEESAAIYCYARVTNIDGTSVQLTYQRIREEDRELLIRSTLHIQSKQLKLRAEQRTQSI
ncbi:PilZ domain-containing protein [Psychromonas sp. MME2]|uniref:PilZ domain-containing protein n=1 Tax=unclassified Psychromonas TaxID=2614957 RepID=UPI00339BF327